MKLSNDSLLTRNVFKAIGMVVAVTSAPGLMAQEQAQSRESTAQKTVTVTGSNIKRAYREGSLPILMLDRTYIEQSSATSATELIQSVPQMQNSGISGAATPAGRR
jgi:outer membrane cobalamin receptor